MTAFYGTLPVGEDGGIQDRHGFLAVLGPPGFVVLAPDGEVVIDHACTHSDKRKWLSGTAAPIAFPVMRTKDRNVAGFRQNASPGGKLSPIGASEPMGD